MGMEPTDRAIAAGRVLELAILYGLQAYVGPVSDKALDEILYRAAHGVLQVIEPHPWDLRVAMLPSIVRILLSTFLQEIAIADEAYRFEKCWRQRDHLTSHSAAKPHAS